jgi:hypothetical protein
MEARVHARNAVGSVHVMIISAFREILFVSHRYVVAQRLIKAFSPIRMWTRIQSYLVLAAIWASIVDRPALQLASGHSVSICRSKIYM